MSSSSSKRSGSECRSVIAAFIVLLPVVAVAAPRHFSLPSYRANPGGLLDVPLVLDNAAGLAAIQVNINFDPDVLTLQAADSGDLGGAFEFSHGESEGSVQIVLARPDNLAGGSGRLAHLRFQANPGAESDLFSELAIADLVLSDETGVIDLRQKDDLTTTNGQVLVSIDGNIDNAGNGLPDWWETSHGLDPFDDNAGLDSDGDGLENRSEYAFGADPMVADAALRRPHVSIEDDGGESFLGIGFFRRPDDPFVRYRPQQSADLASWVDLDPAERLAAPPDDEGDGTEYLRVLSTLQMTGPGASPKGFMRVEVEAAE